MAEREQDLPEGVINAEPAGGWSSDEAAHVGDGDAPDAPIESDLPSQGADPDVAPTPPMNDDTDETDVETTAEEDDA